jgi:uncharacterized LabA/DUF88 family protein
MERLYVACDVSNLWTSSRELFGLEARLDFKILASLVSEHRQSAPLRQELVAYVVTTPKHSSGAFQAALAGYGYKVRARQMTVAKAFDSADRHIVGRTDWDVGITIDAIDKLDDYDTFVLMSGDGDFTQLLEYLRTKGKRTLVISFKHSTSKALVDVADEHVFLDRNVVYMLDQERS